MSANDAKPSLRDRLSSALLKPVDPDAASTKRQQRSEEELRAASKSLTDQERLIGLFAAPLTAAIGLIVVDAQISDATKLHKSVSVYHWEQLVFFVLAVAMLGFAWYRKRLYLGMVIALSGLTFFNLKYWGFGVPIILVGAWLLVRAYRANRDLKEATGELPPRHGAASARGPGANKRYTPPVSKPKPAKQK